MPRGHKSHGFENPKKSVLDESNPLSYLPDNRNVQADYYRLENRNKQLAMIENLSLDEQSYILGEKVTDAAVGQKRISGAVQQLHEADLLELKCLVYLQKLPDSSPELFALKQWCGCESREMIAKYIAEKEMKKLVISQVTRIAGGDSLNQLYDTIITRGPTAFSSLYSAPTASLFGSASSSSSSL